jgi:hypothetical protein
MTGCPSMTSRICSSVYTLRAERDGQHSIAFREMFPPLWSPRTTERKLRRSEILWLWKCSLYLLRTSVEFLLPFPSTRCLHCFRLTRNIIRIDTTLCRLQRYVIEVKTVRHCQPEHTVRHRITTRHKQNALGTSAFPNVMAGVDIL